MKVYAVIHGWYDMDGSFCSGVENIFTSEADAQQWAEKLRARDAADDEGPETVTTVRQYELLDALPPEPASWAAERQALEARKAADEAEAQEQADEEDYPDSGLPRNWN